MKILRSVALFIAILIPSYAIAEASHSSSAPRDCCPGCPFCNH